MNDNSNRVLNGFLRLNPVERQEVLQEIEKYQRSDYTQKSQTERLLEQRSLGPKNTVCPSCGR